MDTGGAWSQIRGHLVAHSGVMLRGVRERGVSAGGGVVRVLVLQVAYCLFKRQF